jgi:hypothetical protein
MYVLDLRIAVWRVKKGHVFLGSGSDRRGPSKPDLDGGAWPERKLHALESLISHEEILLSGEQSVFRFSIEASAA